MGKWMKTLLMLRWCLKQIKSNVKNKASKSWVQKEGEERNGDALSTFIFHGPKAGVIYRVDKAKEVLIKRWKINEEERESAWEDDKIRHFEWFDSRQKWVMTQMNMDLKV